MARIRSIKPEFFKHLELNELENANKGQYVMMVYAGLWTQCDKNGVFYCNDKVLKNEILPYVDFDIKITLSILEKERYFIKYKSEKKEYGYIPNFNKYQFCSANEKKCPAKYPKPPKDIEQIETIPSTSQDVPDNILEYSEDVYSNDTDHHTEPEGLQDKGLQDKRTTGNTCGKPPESDTKHSKPKKPRLRDREPENDIEFVEKAYWTNWDMLYSRQSVTTEDPVVNWGQTRKLIKQHFDRNITPIQLVDVINSALKDNWIIQKGYSLEKILACSYVNSVINKIQVIDNETTTLVIKTPLYTTALDCFTKEPKTKAVIFQDEYSKNMQLQCLQELIARCIYIAPDMPKELFQNITEHFWIMCNGKYKGKWTYTPRCLKTNWIWELVIDSLPEEESTEVREIIREMFK